MIEKIICETDNNYESLSDDKKFEYQKIWMRSVCCPERYILSVDFASPDSKDYSVVTKFNYEEYLKGNMVIESVEKF